MLKTAHLRATVITWVYSGCSVTHGTATAVVTAIGMDTKMGKIANSLGNEDESQTPLQKKLAQLGKHLGIADSLPALSFLL